MRTASGADWRRLLSHAGVFAKPSRLSVSGRGLAVAATTEVAFSPGCRIAFARGAKISRGRDLPKMPSASRRVGGFCRFLPTDFAKR